MMIGDFDHDIDGGDYLILIDKIDVSAVLDVEGLEGSYYINGKTKLTDLYVGATIEFTNIEVVQERLGCYYYTYNLGSDKEYLTDNQTETGTPQTILRVTSELLEKIDSNTINLGVVVVKRYKFEVSIVNQEYLLEDGFVSKYCDTSTGETMVGNDYVLGTYCDKGTELTFSVAVIVENKYDIDCNGIVCDEINLGDIVITLDQNYYYVITITPKNYQISVDEYIYDSLSQIDSANPTLVTSGAVNNMTAKGQYYNADTVVEFIREVSGDRQLSAVHISGNDKTDNLIVVFNGNMFEVYKNSIDNDNKVNIYDYGYMLEITNYNTVKLRYVTLNDLSIRFEYKDYKTIRVG